MDLAAARTFLRANPRAVLTTLRRNGTPQLSPVLIAVDDDGRGMVSTTETTVKVRNLRRDPRVWACVLNERFFGDWVLLEGTATIESLPEAMEPLVDYYRRLSGEHPDWDDYRRAMQEDGRVLLRLELTRAGPDATR